MDVMLELTQENTLKEKVLQENLRVHALENRLYLPRHPEQTNFFQSRVLRNFLNQLDRHLKDSPSSILDLGCGTGYLYLPLLERGHTLTGVDLSDEMIDVLQQQVPQEAKSRSTLLAMEVEAFLATEAQTYDAVVLSALLHHLYDYESVVNKVCAKVKPGGMLMIFFEPLRQKVTSPVRYGLHKSLARLDEAVYKMDMKLKRIPLLEEDYEFSDYQRRFGGIDPNRLVELLTVDGMETLDVEKYCSRRYGIPAFISTCVLKTQNTFNLLARKKGGRLE